MTQHLANATCVPDVARVRIELALHRQAQALGVGGPTHRLDRLHTVAATEKGADATSRSPREKSRMSSTRPRSLSLDRRM